MTSLSRRQFGKWMALAGGAATVAGCAPWEYSDPQHALAGWLGDETPAGLEWRVLNRLAFGARPGDFGRLRRQGVNAWIEEQLEGDSIGESPDLTAALARLDTLELDAEAARDRETEWELDDTVAPVVKKIVKYGKPPRPRLGPVCDELAQATVLRATYSSRQLVEVMVEFWIDHFNIDQTKGDCRWLKPADDALLRQHALGNFRELLGESARSPAMLFYLDNWRNRRFDASRGLQPNENYPRELLELHTLGDTTSYTQADIREAARVLTGWTIHNSWGDISGETAFRPADHDDDEKIVLGRSLPAGQHGGDLDQLLDQVASHPLTARSIAGKLCVRFLGAAPPELRDSLSQVFLRTGGNVRQVLAALLTSDAFRHGDQPLFRRPFQFAISALRGLGARTSGAAIVPHLELMGQRPFRWAQPDGYPMAREPWLSNLLPCWRFAIDLARNQIGETWIDLAACQRAVQRHDPAVVCQQLAHGLLGRPLDGEALDTLTALGDASSDVLPQWLALLLISPQFHWC